LNHICYLNKICRIRGLYSRLLTLQILCKKSSDKGLRFLARPEYYYCCCWCIIDALTHERMLLPITPTKKRRNFMTATLTSGSIV